MSKGRGQAANPAAQARSVGAKSARLLGDEEVLRRRLLIFQRFTIVGIGLYAVEAILSGYVVAATVHSWATILLIFAAYVRRFLDDLQLSARAMLLALWLSMGICAFTDGMIYSKGMFLISIVPSAAAYLLGEKVAIRWALGSVLTVSAVTLIGSWIEIPMEYDPRRVSDWLRIHGVEQLSFLVLAIVGATRSRKVLWEQERQGLELDRANEAAQASNRAKTAFLARVSHEIRTPMHGLLGMTQLLRTRPLSAEDLECVSTVERCAENLQALLNDALDLDRVEAGKLDICSVRTAMSGIVSDTCVLFSAKAEMQGVEIHCSLPQEEVFAWADAKRVRQILSNLVGNALKFGGGKDIEVELRKEGRGAGGGAIRIAVRDFGIGLTFRERESLFQAYAQLERGKQEAEGGTGLGLAISQDLARQMGGVIRVESEAGQGSTFTLELSEAVAPERCSPLAESSSANCESEDLAPSLQGSVVLVVDDNEVNRRVACLQLRAWGCTVQEARNGIVAVQMASERPYSMILMDVQMPEMDGLEATLRIRAGEMNAQTPIVAVTANAYEGDKELCREAGMDDHLAKPYKREQLQAMCRRHIRGPGHAQAA